MRAVKRHLERQRQLKKTAHLLANYYFPLFFVRCQAEHMACFLVLTHILIVPSSDPVTHFFLTSDHLTQMTSAS